MHRFKTGELVYYDSMAGLVKCKIIAMNWDSTPTIMPNSQKFTLRVTALNHPIYKHGEFIESSRLWTIPRSSVYIHSGQYRIRSY
jgi:hypothetical protein